MKSSYQHYLSALASYEEGANRLSETSQRNTNMATEIIQKGQQQNIPIQPHTSLVEHLADPENRVPSQLYAVIGEIVRLIKNIEQK
ncbi:flagellar biosynthesis protein FlhB [Thermaerobacillus caldiproteolyticus]|uniref:flagellar biosynthesis protein FlhB n=1 Tax=Thermaerobacillus caldiproteolyticus TaxID=247480 RepID=UPI00188D0562|nr:flagellar biosynthesis protein FlhB [Anoxybacillus caldiproteolyticus]QPA30721.1 flagellar biosynthesis protein FlhB [Anoxybacillus caldiproteolyticus]